MMSPSIRKAMLVVHVTCSVAWIGAVAAFLVLAVQGVTREESEIVRAAYLGMNAIGLYVIVPLSMAALLTGLIQALGTPWGLLRHYWVVAKLGLTLLATLLLLLHQFIAVARAAAIASATPVGQPFDVGSLGSQLVFDAAAALVVLVGIVAISVFKPWGRTRAEANDPTSAAGQGRPFPIGKAAVIGLAVLAIAAVMHHLLGGHWHHRH